MLFYLDTTAESAGDIVAISNYMTASGDFIDSNNSVYKNILTIVDALVDAIKFKDVEETAWYYKDVNESVKLGLMNGDNGFFRPSDNLTVGQAMKLVAVIHAGYHNNMNRIPIPATTGHWAINYYSYVANYGIAPDWQFSINELERTITRGEMAMLFANALGEGAFYVNSDSTNVVSTLSLNNTSVGTSCFYYNTFDNVSISGGTLGETAFAYTTTNNKLSLLDSVVIQNSNCFANRSYADHSASINYLYIDVPAVVVTAGSLRTGPFENCIFDVVEFGPSCTELRENCFLGASINTVKGLSNLKLIESKAFDKSVSCVTVVEPAVLTNAEIQSGAFSSYSSNIGYFDFDSLTLENCSVGDGAFYHQNFDDLKISGCTLEQYAFAGVDVLNDCKIINGTVFNDPLMFCIWNTLYENDLVSEDAATRMKFIGADYYVDNTGESGTNNGIFDIYGNSYFDSSSALNVHTGFGWMQSHLIYSAKAHSTEIGQSDNEIMSSHVRTGTKITSSMGTWSHRYWHLSDPVILETIFKNPKSNENPGLTVEGDSSSGVQTFLAYAESPYYYFYNVLRERFSASGTDGFKKSMLMDSSYKHNATGMYSDDELRDFLDLEGLFTTVIPVLNQSNMYVREYEETFGLNIESYDFEGYLGEKTDSFNEAQEQKNKVRQVWMMYCPWVDYLYELDVTDETTKWGGKKVTVSDALNPGYYDEANRPMIYSKADMAAKHANESNLTTTEIRIQNVLDDTYKDMLYLLNYYDFSDEALISAAAMSATFNFNKEFSGSSLLGTNATIYPQSC